jgi:hypothetical protein
MPDPGRRDARHAWLHGARADRQRHRRRPAADVYARGATLFEVLAREPVHPRGTGALTTTAAGVDGSPGRRRDVPPELDALCIAALALDPAARPSAGALADGVQRYLDGDRETTLRRRGGGARTRCSRPTRPARGSRRCCRRSRCWSRAGCYRSCSSASACSRGPGR